MTVNLLQNYPVEKPFIGHVFPQNAQESVKNNYFFVQFCSREYTYRLNNYYPPAR